jgi:hypothetical protein
MTKQVNAIQTPQNTFDSVHLSLLRSNGLLSLFAFLLVDFDFLLSEVYKKHISPANYEMYQRPKIYVRIIIGIHLGYNRQQLALLVGNGWTIRINSLVRLGYALPASKYHKIDMWESLILSEKGSQLYTDLMQSIERYLNGLEQPIPWAEYKKKGLNKRLAPTKKK